MTYLALKNRRLIRKLAQAMRRMSPHDRKIFLGHFAEQAPFIELAHLHSISLAEVEAALRRGIEIVAAALEPATPRERRFWRPQASLALATPGPRGTGEVL